MNSTKKNILKSARALFNERGVAVVSQRTIAEDLNISPGNLTYHFKKRSEIIEALYFELVEVMDATIANIAATGNLLEGLFAFVRTNITQFYEYRFMFLDFIQIVRQNENIKNHFSKMMKTRDQQFALLLQALVDTGVLRKEEYDHEYDYLIKRMTVFGNFYLASAELNKQEFEEKDMEEYIEIYCLSIYPYLTAKGKKLYRNLS